MQAVALPAKSKSTLGHAALLAAGWLLTVVAIATGTLAAMVVFVVATTLTAIPLVLVLSALLTQMAVTYGLAWIAAGRIAPAHRKRVALAVGAGATLCTALVATLLLFGPLATASDKLVMPADAAYWDLSTGSRIAYLKVPASASAESKQTNPIIRLHGGPGAYGVSNTRFLPLYSELAGEGFDVYTYDQVGSGLSARLSNPAEYTLARHIDDLEAIRRQIGAEQIALMADSWGATLAAGYMAAHPERVARVVLTSPAPMDYSEWRDLQWQDITARLPAERQQQIEALQSEPRFMSLVLLSRINPQAAYNLSSDAELDTFFDQWTGKMLPGMLCDPASYPPDDMPHGFGFWANVMTGSDASLHSKGQRAALATNHTPTLIMKGECDYIKWDVVQQYKDTLPNSTLLYVPRAGHAIYYDQPGIYTHAVKAFLLDR